jgi:hypothetical protein
MFEIFIMFLMMYFISIKFCSMCFEIDGFFNKKKSHKSLLGEE